MPWRIYIPPATQSHQRTATAFPTLRHDTPRASPPSPRAGLTSDQILNSFASTDYVAAAMCCAPTAITVTNGDGSTIVFGALNSACPITGGHGSSYGASICTNALGGNTTFSNLLNWTCWSGGSDINIISIPNLVPGQQYIVE